MFNLQLKEFKDNINSKNLQSDFEPEGLGFFKEPTTAQPVWLRG